MRHPPLGDHEGVGDQPRLRGVGDRPGKESVREIARVEGGRDLVDVGEESLIQEAPSEYGKSEHEARECDRIDRR